MSSVTCLFEPVNTPVSEYDRHKNVIANLVESWGFQIIPVAEDGNCCFYALAFSIHSQHEDVKQKLPQSYLILSMQVYIANKLRLIAVDEWMNHQDEYQYYLSEGYKVTEEAPQFLQTFWTFG